MAEYKKSFLIYSDTINNISHLTNEEKGILFQHLLEYVNDLNPTLTDRLILTAWKPIETHLKRDLKKWNDKAPDRSAKARKAGLASAKARQLKVTKSNYQVKNELKPTKSTVNVNVSVNDNVNDILNKENIKEKVFIKTSNNEKNVKLKIEEIETLKEKLGEGGFLWVTNKLSNYKLSKGKKYKSDYGAINSWVIKEFEKEKTNGKKINGAEAFINQLRQ